MTADELRHEQAMGRRSDLSHLANECMRRYLKAAQLVGVEGAATEAIRDANRTGYELTPLLGAWQAICERYIREAFDLQVNLFKDHAKHTLDCWRAFLYRDLYPSLLEDDEFVRDVLRCLRLLPCAAPLESEEAVRHKMNVAYVPPLPRTPVRGGSND